MLFPEASVSPMSLAWSMVSHCLCIVRPCCSQELPCFSAFLDVLCYHTAEPAFSLGIFDVLDQDGVVLCLCIVRPRHLREWPCLLCFPRCSMLLRSHCHPGSH